MKEEFKIFNERVKTYYPLNKENTRYLILMKDGTHGFYKFNKLNNSLTFDEIKVLKK